MNGLRHLSHVDRLRIERNRSDNTHKVRAILSAIQENFFSGSIRTTIDSSKEPTEVHVLRNKSHDNATRGIKESAKARFDVEVTTVEKDGYEEVLQFHL